MSHVLILLALILHFCNKRIVWKLFGKLQRPVAKVGEHSARSAEAGELENALEISCSTMMPRRFSPFARKRVTRSQDATPREAANRKFTLRELVQLAQFQEVSQPSTESISIR